MTETKKATGNEYLPLTTGYCSAERKGSDKRIYGRQYFIQKQSLL